MVKLIVETELEICDLWQYKFATIFFFGLIGIILIKCLIIDKNISELRSMIICGHNNIWARVIHEF
jgi:hypothetical protein